MIARARATWVSRRAGSPGPGREDHAIDVRRQHVRRRGRVREDADARAAMAHRADDVRFEAEVHDPDERTAIGRVPELRDRRRRDLRDEVLVLPARDGGRGRASRLGIRVAGGGHDPAQAPVGAEMARERPRVDAGDRRDPVAAQERRQLSGVIEHGGRRIGDDEGAQPRPDRLVVGQQPPVVADERIGHHDDLAGVRGVGADLLVPGLAGVDDEVAAGRHRRPRTRRPGRPSRPPAPAMPAPRHRSADRRSHSRGAAGGRSRDGGTKRPTRRIGVVGEGVRGHLVASFAGLTGPIRQPHRTGHERTSEGYYAGTFRAKVSRSIPTNRGSSASSATWTFGSRRLRKFVSTTVSPTVSSPCVSTSTWR